MKKRSSKGIVLLILLVLSLSLNIFLIVFDYKTNSGIFKKQTNYSGEWQCGNYLLTIEENGTVYWTRNYMEFLNDPNADFGLLKGYIVDGAIVINKSFNEDLYYQHTGKNFRNTVDIKSIQNDCYESFVLENILIEKQSDDVLVLKTTEQTYVRISN